MRGGFGLGKHGFLAGLTVGEGPTLTSTIGPDIRIRAFDLVKVVIESARGRVSRTGAARCCGFLNADLFSTRRCNGHCQPPVD
jgi:hypothetical protein